MSIPQANFPWFQFSYTSPHPSTLDSGHSPLFFRPATSYRKSRRSRACAKADKSRCSRASAKADKSRRSRASAKADHYPLLLPASSNIPNYFFAPATHGRSVSILSLYSHGDSSPGSGGTSGAWSRTRHPKPFALLALNSK